MPEQERIGLVVGPFTTHVGPFADYIESSRPPQWRETIACAAIRCPHGRVFSLPRPARHHHLIWWMTEEYGYQPREMNGKYQGFVTSTGRYVDRVEGLEIARAAGQIKQKCGNERLLFSEDVW